jgi:hypothetical protein
LATLIAASAGIAPSSPVCRAVLWREDSRSVGKWIAADAVIETRVARLILENVHHSKPEPIPVIVFVSHMFHLKDNDHHALAFHKIRARHEF